MNWSKFRTRCWNVCKYGLLGGVATGGAVIAIALYSRKTGEGHLHVECTENNTKWDFNWDRREPKSLVKPLKPDGDKTDYENKLKKMEAKVSRHIILVRHGQYDMSGVTDKERVLTEQGRIQADYTARRLEEFSVPFEQIVSSTMSRAVETAEIIRKKFPSVPYAQTDMLREGAPVYPDPPSIYWKPEPHVVTPHWNDNSSINAHMCAYLDGPIGDLKLAMEFFTDGARIEAAFRKYFHRAEYDQKEDSYDLLVCHGNVIRYCVCRVLQVPPGAWLRMCLDHASITWVTILPTGRVLVSCVGGSGHMPVAIKSF